MTTQSAFVEPAENQRFRYDATGDITTYAELVKDVAPDLRPRDEHGYKLFLDIMDITPID